MRGWGLIVVAVVCLLGAGCASCQKEQPIPDAGPAQVVAPPPPPPVVPPPEEPGGKVTVAIGKVEVKRVKADSWAPIAQGDTIYTEDTVRTDDGAEVTISVSDVKISVHERSELQVTQVDRKGVKARAKGRINSEVPEGGELTLSTEGSDAVVVSEGGHFAMSSDGHGVVAVAAVKGQVALSAAGKSVSMKEGQASHVEPGKAPVAPKKLLRNVLLAVKWPTTETNQPKLPVAGQVQPGTTVLVQGLPVRVRPDGRFSAEVKLRHGRQKVAVVAVDVLGRKKRSVASVLSDKTLPDVKLQGQLWQ